MCFKVLLCENHLEKLFYQQKEQDADTSSEGLKSDFQSASWSSLPFFTVPFSWQAWQCSLAAYKLQPRDFGLCNLI